MQAFLESFFHWLGIQVDTLEIKEEGEDLFIRIETPDSPILIGQHGKNMEALKHLLWRIAERKLEKYIHVQLEVNDYMKAKDERLFRFLESKIAFSMSTWTSVKMPNLSPFERKKAHNYIFEKKIEWLTTHSEGEGEERALVLHYSGKIVPVIQKTTHSTTSRDIDSLSEDGVGI